MSKVYKTMKANKREVAIAFIAGAILVFFINNFTSQNAYDFISCTWNANDCPGLEWDGQCTNEIEEDCCDYVDIDYCGGQSTINPEECYHYYCTSSGDYCAPVYNQEGSYDCTCKSIEEVPL